MSFTPVKIESALTADRECALWSIGDICIRTKAALIGGSTCSLIDGYGVPRSISGDGARLTITMSCPPRLPERFGSKSKCIWPVELRDSGDSSEPRTGSRRTSFANSENYSGSLPGSSIA